MFFIYNYNIVLATMGWLQYVIKWQDDPDTQQRLLGQLYSVMDVNPSLASVGLE